VLKTKHIYKLNYRNENTSENINITVNKSSEFVAVREF
jgi:hypothetical protein